MSSNTAMGPVGPQHKGSHEGNHHKEKSLQHSDVGKLDKISKDKSDKDQANATALFERRDINDNVGGAGAWSMNGNESREKRGNKEQQSEFSNAVLWVPRGGSAADLLAWILSHWLLALASVVVLLLCCSICLLAQMLARQHDRLEGQDVAAGSFVVEDSISRNCSGSASSPKSGSFQGAQNVSGLSAKDKKARKKTQNKSMAPTRLFFDQKQIDDNGGDDGGDDGEDYHEHQQTSQTIK